MCSLYRGCLAVLLMGCMLGIRAEAQVPNRIEVHPSAIQLDSRRAYRQMVVTGYFGGVPHDVTAQATYKVADSKMAKASGSRIEAVGEGQTTLAVRYGGKSVQVPVCVTHTSKPDPISFKFETRAILTKQGCATGSCHGSPHGKGGFSLSLFGYDPTIDRVSLTHDGYNRRVNVLDPAESLMLKKPLLEIPHVGGKRLRKNEVAYQILTNWIYQGVNTDLPKVECDRIQITPASGRVLKAPFLRQQIGVLAHFTDGSLRDVSRIATYDTSNSAVATVDSDGLISAHSRGQAAISVRYLDSFESIPVTVVVDVPGFHWNNPPETNFVDRLVDNKLQQLQYLPSERCNDSVFLRRLSLDFTGLLPTAEQSRHFLTDTASDKRLRLIDTLLNSEEFARFQALKKADLMRVSPARLKEGRAGVFSEWLVSAMRTNMPYDRFARAILTAEGDTERVPTANYFLAIPSMEERTEMTAQIFMGTRIECTKCHNHPFENWTMRDYYRIAAVFARTKNEGETITLASTGEAQHPTTHEVMTPWGMTSQQQQNHVERRTAFAEWLTSPDNPYFARVEVNRIWADLMGRGIVEPIDDFRSSNPPSNAPLLDALAQEFVKSGYNRKHILRLIASSRTYQSSSMPNAFNGSDESLFSHAKVRLLTAEQLQDALGTATRLLPPPSELEVRLPDVQKQVDVRTAELTSRFPTWLTSKEGAEAQKQFALTPKGKELLALPPDKCEERLKATLLRRYLEQDNDLRNLKQRLETLQQRMDYATQRPYPQGTEFTTTFGQPKRETACTCERQHSPTLLQALEMLNGGTAFRLAQESVSRYAAFDNERLVEELYLSALCRFPTEREKSVSRGFLTSSSDRNRAVMDLIWTVMNTQEFLFQH